MEKIIVNNIIPYYQNLHYDTYKRTIIASNFTFLLVTTSSINNKTFVKCLIVYEKLKYLNRIELTKY